MERNGAEITRSRGNRSVKLRPWTPIETPRIIPIRQTVDGLCYLSMSIANAANNNLNGDTETDQYINYSQIMAELADDTDKTLIETAQGVHWVTLSMERNAVLRN